MNNSAKRVLEILTYVSESGEPLTVTDICRALGYPKTSVFDIVTILCEQGFLRRENERAKTYQIGVKAYQVGMAYINTTDLYSIAHPILTGVRNRLGETCYLAIEEDGYIFYLDKVESSSPIRSTCNIGSKNAMYLTGLGKAILAGLPDQRVREIASRGMEPHTKTTITTLDGLYEELSEIRRRGCAYDMGEDNPHVRCAAAPIRNASGECCAAVSISMLDVTFTTEMKEKATQEIISAAEQISYALGYRGKSLF
ncbi:MAG: IclR family transcriptional regulator [Clostridia bacterium]|nr:IclR family transcriptional regulator [Clostridia bacterium]